MVSKCNEMDVISPDCDEVKKGKRADLMFVDCKKLNCLNIVSTLSADKAVYQANFL
jgi:hypothetical protein